MAAPMTMALTLDSALEKEFNDNKDGKSLRWLKIIIKDEKLVGDGTGKASDEAKADLSSLQASMASQDECFYGVIRVNDEGEWIILAYIPDTSKVKARMQYASTLLHLKKTLGDCCIGDARVTSKDEVSWSTVTECVAKKKGQVDNSDCMTDAERVKKEVLEAEEKERKEQTTAVTGSTGGAHTLKFPMNDAAKEALEKIAKKEWKACTIGTEGEKLLLVEKFEKASLADVVKTLEKESRFIVYNHEHEDEEVTVFIYFASDQCPVKKRMQYASSKAAVAHYAQDAGCEIAKSCEFADASDITLAAINEALKPAATEEEEEEEKKSKPKPPSGARGPRMLI